MSIFKRAIDCTPLTCGGIAEMTVLFLGGYTGNPGRVLKPTNPTRL